MIKVLFAYLCVLGNLFPKKLAAAVVLSSHYYIMNNTNGSYTLVFLNYIFALIVYYFFYTIIHLDSVIYDGYWTSYFLTLGIQAIICLPLTAIDRQIKKGHER